MAKVSGVVPEKCRLLWRITLQLHEYERSVYHIGCTYADGRFNGALSSVPATRLGAAAIKAAVERAGIKPTDVNEVFMGNVLQANLGRGSCNTSYYLCRLA